MIQTYPDIKAHLTLDKPSNEYHQYSLRIAYAYFCGSHSETSFVRHDLQALYNHTIPNHYLSEIHNESKIIRKYYMLMVIACYNPQIYNLQILCDRTKY